MLTENEQLARRLYPDVEWDADYFSGPSDYGPMIDDVANIILWRTCGDYEGDFHVLVEGPGIAFGYVCIGYGSCSGCDALQGAESAEEIGRLARGIQNSIHWVEGRDEMRKWMLERDWEAQYSWHEADFKGFLRTALELLDATPEEIDALFDKFDT